MICNFNHARVHYIGRYGNLRRDHHTFIDDEGRESAQLWA